MTVPYFTETEIGNSLWDELFLGGVNWPGVWEVTVTKGRDIDKVKQKGKDGRTLTDNGYEGAELEAVGRIFRQSDFDDLQDILPRFDPKVPGATRTPHDIYHPAAALLGVDAVYIEKIRVTPPKAGVLTVTLTISEYFPETKNTNNKKEVQGFDGAQNSGAPLNAQDFQVNSVSTALPNL